MRRRPVALVLGLLLLAACSSDDDGEGAARTTSTSTSSPASTTPTTAGAACRGLGDAPPADTGVITWVADGKLWDTDGCLAEVRGGTTVTGWGGRGDRVAVDNIVLVGASAPAHPFDEGPLALSRPRGTAVLRITEDGNLLKRELEGGEPRDISFMAEHEFAVYHPAGRSIVSSGRNEEGGAELLIADNNGGDPRRLLTIEEARHVHNPAFTRSGALLYTADHGTHWDLHRLVIGEDTFSTIATVQAPGVIADVVASPFEKGGVAWTEGRCAAAERPRLKATQDGRDFAVPAEVAAARPVGWLPDGGLVVIDRGGCEPDTTGTLYVVRAGTAAKVADGVLSAAVRAVLPPPPAPPKEIPQQAPA